MERLDAPTTGLLLTPRRWLHRNLGMIALYRWASDYGNNYVKPMLWLLGALVLFAALYPLPHIGFGKDATGCPLTYTAAKGLWSNLALFGMGFLSAIDTATFQRATAYTRRTLGEGLWRSSRRC